MGLSKLISRMDTRGRVALPQVVRDVMALEPGDVVEWENTGEGKTFKVKKL
jgi:bifunctional DNA-binding transcriptional regulator/antitoxin component of YhaV-PrlF toxin-antitoxin module